MEFHAIEQYVKVNGRTLMKDGVRYLGYSCSGIEFLFTGTKAEAVLWSDSPSLDQSSKAWVAVFINDEEQPSKRFVLDEKEKTYLLYEGNAVKETKVKLVKYSEAAFGKVGVKSIMIDGENPAPVSDKNRKLEFIGDSITCGYGIEGKFLEGDFTTSQENPWNAYAATTARVLDADYHLVSWSGIGIISNYTVEDVPNDEWLMPPLYRYTDKAMDLTLGSKNPEVWDNGKFIPDCIIVNLGTNDMSYVKNIPDRVETFGNHYYDFIKQIRSKNSNARIICTLGVMGQDLCSEIEHQVNRLNSEGETDIYYMQFELQQEKDGIGTYWHPSPLTHRKMAEKLEKKIKEIMKW